MYDIPYEIVEYPIDKKEQNKRECQNKLNLDPSWKHVVNVGLFTPRKNQKYLFEIAEKLKEKKLKESITDKTKLSEYDEAIANSRGEYEKLSAELIKEIKLIDDKYDKEV